MPFFNPQSESILTALKQWRSRRIVPTVLSAAKLREVGRQIMERSVISARTTSAKYLGRVAEVLDSMIGGVMDKASGRWELIKKLSELGYDAETGFPEDMGKVPPAERGTMADLASGSRLNLLLETNQRTASNYGKLVVGNSEYALYNYPAWRMVRYYVREIERGSPESRSAGWLQRWRDAGESVDWVGAIKHQLIAMKDSPIWDALADGAGGYTDAIGNGYPPFAFNSGMGWEPVPRAEVERLFADHPFPHPSSGRLEPDETEAPAETTPAETTPAETTPAETTPAETTPAETTPAETTPAETTPAETTPAETTPAETTPAETPPAETPPEGTTPPKIKANPRYRDLSPATREINEVFDSLPEDIQKAILEELGLGGGST